MNIGAINTISATTGVQGSVAMPLQGRRSQDGRPAVQAVEQRPVDNEQMQHMVHEMQRQIDSMNVSLEFSTYGEHGDKIAVVVADKNTGEVIREIPSREIQDLYAKMREITGIIFNKQA